MIASPIPGDNATPVDTVETVRLGPGQRGTVTFQPERSGTRFYLTTVAISKRQAAAYKIEMDSSTEWDAAIPPTDVDDLQATFAPAKEFGSSMRVVIDDLRGSGSKRDYHVQPVGWEEPAGTGG